MKNKFLKTLRQGRKRKSNLMNFEEHNLMNVVHFLLSCDDSAEKIQLLDSEFSLIKI